MKGKTWLLALALLILAPVSTRSESPGETRAGSPKTYPYLAPPTKSTPSPAAGLWEGFRKLHPYHIQLVALSKPQFDGTRVLIVSEPPPHATVEGIKSCSPEPGSFVEVKQRTVGHDGWVRDVVATLPPMKGPQVAELVDQLHDYLFGTTYKAEALELPLTPLPAGRTT